MKQLYTIKNTTGGCIPLNRETFHVHWKVENLCRGKFCCRCGETFRECKGKMVSVCEDCAREVWIHIYHDIGDL